MDWQDYPIPGVTYGHNPKYMCPFTALDRTYSAQTEVAGAGGPVNSSPAVLRCEFPAGVSGHHARPRSAYRNDTFKKIDHTILIQYLDNGFTYLVFFLSRNKFAGIF